MPRNKKPTYEELGQRLAEAEQMLDAIRRGEVDAVLAQEHPIVLRPRELERKLRESEAALVEAQAIAKIGSWQYDVAQDKPTWSQEMFHIFDRDPARGEPPWQEHQEFIHPEDWERLDQAVRNAIEKGRPFRAGSRIIRRDGSTIWAETIGKAHRNEAGEVFSLSGTVQDIDERKQAELALVESEKKYRSLYSSIRDAILVADSNRKIIDCNPTFSALFGYALEDIKGKETSTIYASLDEFSRMGQEIRAHGGDQGFQIVADYQKNSGEIFPGETSVHYIHSDDGELIGFIGIIRDVSQKIADEQALLESENRFRTAFESAPEGMALIDAERQFIRVNKRVCEIFGYSEDELLGKSFNQFTHPDDRQSGRERWREIFEENNDTNRTEKRFIHKNGNIVWCVASNTAIRNDQGGVEYVLSHIYDITARVNYQQDLIRERDLSQKYLDTAGVILLALDKQGRIEMINRKGCEIIGCFTEDLLGQNWIDNFIPEDLRPEIKTIHRNIIAGLAKPHTHEECPIIINNGQQKQVRWFNTALTDSNGNITGTLSSGEDITEYKAAQEAVNRLATIVESSQDAITGKDIQGIITSWNDAAERIYGYGAEEAIGQHISLIVPEDKHGELEQVLTAVGRGEAFRIHETVRRRKDGGLVDVSLSVSPVRDDTGQVVGAATIAHVITEMKKARQEKEKLETQLRQTQKMEAIGTLAGGIAHDFNNILAAIMGYSELVLDELPSDSEAAQNLETVITAANRAKDLTYQILSFSRQTEHKQVTLDLEPLIKEILKMLRATLPSTIEIKQNVPAGTGEVMADPVQIHQILMNLCTNAAQAMEKTGGVLSVDLDVVDIDELTANGYVGLAPGRYQRLRVSDTGVGMDKEVLERIFEPFYTTKEVGKGTGMGLSVVHGIVKNYGGTITVYSEPDQGSNFHVYLPLANGESEQKQPNLPRELPRGSESILFVDDEPPLVDIGKKTLSRLGYQVRGFTSAQEALEAFKAAPDDFNLLITDYTMPKMTGVQLTREVLAIKPDLPIIMCTGFSERLSSVSSQEIGVTRLAMKPLMPREIARIIGEVLGKE
ncbi:MAG: PAS domain S-box protein [Desulfarculaceae bacterium]|nr:PAS domain S-box protein [Desulfarculaceae bacterium]MCF8072429.1 PAS domain S-box protein [Desulfarculaceae bacterium]MCF8102890.1 PAS domain S-box protein [Desulfarculaceae bacterium]MCF8118472.1 PAS domain S-box protein [Desulfarculaceae bacterium]